MQETQDVPDGFVAVRLLQNSAGQEGQDKPCSTEGLIVFLAFLAGLSVFTARVMPKAIFPCVIDWAELRTNERREGMYYGAVNLVRKLSSALAILISLQVLGWFGYKAPTAGNNFFIQPERTLFVIRFLTEPLIAILYLFAIAVAWFYPLTRERQNRIRCSLLLQQRRKSV